MKFKTLPVLGTFAAYVAAAALSQAVALAISPDLAFEQNTEILTRGPVHEAFAESVSFEPQAGQIVRMAPPAMIEELPPEQELEGENVSWIPGYWAWDDDQNDYIWISGIWRNLPPGRQWVPGYWSEIDGGGYQWTSGYWSDAEVEEVDYLPTPPPPSVDSGPNIAAPDESQSWVPGNWFWLDTRYVWRPGYWLQPRPNWTWVPARHCWTRRGYVYVNGYWDHAVARRGVLFAPVYFRQGIYSRPNFYYTPSIVVGLNVFTDHLFVRPRCGHYYFGDYYAPRYRDTGFYASYSWHTQRRGYDPIYAYCRWDHRLDRGWEHRQINSFNYFRDHQDARPAHTWAAMRDARLDRFNDGRNRQFATPITSFVNASTATQKFRKLEPEQRTRIVAQSREMRDFSKERKQLEARPVRSESTAASSPSRQKFTRSPILGSRIDRMAKDDAPPTPAQGRMTPMTREKPGMGLTRKGEKPAATEAPSRSTRGTLPPGMQRGSVQPAKPATKTPLREREDNPTTKIAPQPLPGRGASTKAPTPTVPAPKREVKPTRTREPKSVPRPQATPQREVQPARQPQVVPQRPTPTRPQPKVQSPSRQMPERKVERQTAPQTPRTVQPRTLQPRTVQPTPSQPRTVQPRTVQPRTVQPTPSQPRTVQPTPAQPRGNPATRQDPRTGGEAPGRGSKGRNR